MAKAPLIQYAPLTKPELAAALGRLAITHEHLADVLRMTIKIIADMRPGEARRSLPGCVRR